MKVKVITALKPETAVPIHNLRNQLSIFQDLSHPNAWTGHVRGSPVKWKESDAKVIVDAIKDAERNPVERPVNKAKLARRPKAFKAPVIGSVTIPEDDEEIAEQPSQPEPISQESVHTEIQWLLLKLGNDMGLDIWVAKNDRGRSFDGNKFADLQHMKTELPLQFDEVTNKTVELIDVLWLQGNAILAAFEVESTTSIYSGLLRMADLITMQPNLNIPIYIVAPDERRQKVFTEVNRPTFRRLSPPMFEVCRYISFSSLRDQLGKVAPFVRHLKPDILDEVTESCEIEDA